MPPQPLYMKILIACEFSGIVRDAFRAKGHDAWSCDILPPDSPSEFHVETDVRRLLCDGWDMMIAHPPCTYLCSSGIHWNLKRPERKFLTGDAIRFFLELYKANIPKIAVENPIGIMSTFYRKPDQIIQPHWFGHPESKSTCLWLKNLPLLHATNVLTKPDSGRWSNQTPTGQNKLGPSKNRWKERSKTYQGIADAMAAQWG